ncbi:MAG: aldehyde dehydrogenase [Rikenellaceae bacterium]|nr:aldehyde dehydrogenase [Rikenellaceae bacterium]
MQKLEKFIPLQKALADFGGDEASRAVVERAVAENSWFTSRDITASLRAIAADMLSPHALEQWLARYPELPVASPRSVLVFMAGNIPAVGFADLLCVLAAGHRAVVKYSSRDTALMEYVVSLLTEEFDIKVYDPATDTPDALLAMGSDSTAAMLQQQFGAIPRLIRASRTSVAVLMGEESDAQLAALCEDICRYDGRGCRSVSRLLVPSGYDFTPLKRALTQVEVSVKWRAVYTHNRALALMSGAEVVDVGVALLQPSDEAPMNIATLHYTEYSDPAQVVEWIAERDSEIQCIVAASFDHPRCVPFGMAQHPSLTDYPDGIDTMAWLSTL